MPFGHQALAQPVEQALPERAVHQDHRDLAALAGLDQGHRLQQLVEGAEAARHHHVGGGELHEHELAREEVLEGLGDVLVGVGLLLHAAAGC
jgi:hypothetical protein